MGSRANDRESQWRDALADRSVQARFFKHFVCMPQSKSLCWLWTGAISNRGHGRFNVTDGFTVISHRFMFALANGIDALPEVVAHACDEPGCVNPLHLSASTQLENRRDWANRRNRLGSPLRDARGAAVRSREVRDAARNEASDVVNVMGSGTSALDRDQQPLF